MQRGLAAAHKSAFKLGKLEQSSESSICAALTFEEVVAVALDEAGHLVVLDELALGGQQRADLRAPVDASLEQVLCRWPS